METKRQSKQHDRSRKRKEKTSKKKLQPKTHAVTFMTPELEIISRPIIKVPEPKPIYEKAQYGARNTLYDDPSTILQVEPGEFQQPIKTSMDNVRGILSYVDWKVKLYWFHARTPVILQEYWANRSPLSFPADGTPEDPRVVTLERFRNHKVTRIQALLRGVRLRMNIQARLDLAKLHVRYRKAQFVHPKVRTLCFVSLHPCRRWKHRQKHNNSSSSNSNTQQHNTPPNSVSTVLSTSSVDTSAGFRQCPVCASLVLQCIYQRRKADLFCQGVVSFTWYDPSLNKYKESETPILRPWRSERLALRARITQLSATMWEEKLQRFRRNKATHSYAIEEMYRERLAWRQSESIRLVKLWREQQLLTGFTELEEQRKLQGRQLTVGGASAAAAKKVSKARVRRRVSGKTNKKQNIGRVAGGFTKRDREMERTALIRQLRKDALREEEASQASQDKRVAFEEQKQEKLRQEKQKLSMKTELALQRKKERMMASMDEESRDSDEVGEGERVGVGVGEGEGKGEKEEKIIDGVMIQHEQGTEQEGLEGETKEKTEEDNAVPKRGSVEKNEEKEKNKVEQIEIENLKSTDEQDEMKTTESQDIITKQLREERIRKNEDAKVRSYVRRLHLASYVGEEGIRQGAACIAQSLYRMSSARVHAANKRRRRAHRLKRVQGRRWVLIDTQRKKGWEFLLSEYHREQYEAAKSIQGAFRASIARGIVKRARRWRALHTLQPWWRGVWVRREVIPEMQQDKRVEALHRRVLARMKYGGLVYCLHTWYENVVDQKLNRDRLFLLRQIADRKWIRCCAIRIQTCWRRFYYTMIGGEHIPHTTTMSRAHLRILALRRILHPRLEQLLLILETDGDADAFAIDLLGAVETWENPDRVLLLAAQVELGNRVPLEPLPLRQMQAWVEHTLQRVLLWRAIPLHCVLKPCRCHVCAHDEIHRAGYCRGEVQLPFVLFFPFLHVVQRYFVAVEKMREAQRNVVQALQEKRMMETFGKLILADTADRGSRFGHQHPRWSKMSIVTRSRMNSLALGRDESRQDYIRWFVDGVDTCARCRALLSWDSEIGSCCVCGVKRLELPTSSSTLQSKIHLPPLGGRKGETSRNGLYGVGDIEEGLEEFLLHAALCVHAPSGHWRRLAPRWKTWEESRHEWAEPTIQVLSSYGIKTIGSLWLAKISGQLNSIPEMEVEMVNKMSRCLEFLADFIMSELLAPEEYGKEEISEADLEDRIRAMSK